jgi:hypothetical protein
VLYDMRPGAFFQDAKLLSSPPSTPRNIESVVALGQIVLQKVPVKVRSYMSAQNFTRAARLHILMTFSSLAHCLG